MRSTIAATEISSRRSSRSSHRALVEFLLRDFEHMEAKLPRGERYDVGLLRAELNLRR